MPPTAQHPEYCALACWSTPTSTSSLPLRVNYFLQLSSFSQNWLRIFRPWITPNAKACCLPLGGSGSVHPTGRAEEGWLKLREEALWAVPRKGVLRSLTAWTPGLWLAKGFCKQVTTLSAGEPWPGPGLQQVTFFPTSLSRGLSFLFQLMLTLLLDPLGKTHPIG